VIKLDNEEDVLSTPPTEEEEEEEGEEETGEKEDEDGFFSLDVDFDLDKMNSNAERPAIIIKEPSGHTVLPTAKVLQPQYSSPRSKRRLAPEPDALGNLEYKLRLLPPTRHRYDRLLTQMKWRLLQGGGCCTYEIGVLDDGRCIGICPTEMRMSLRVLASLANELGASVRVRRAFILVNSGQSSKGHLGMVNQIRSLDAKEAQRRLLRSRDELADADRLDPCACTTGEEVLACCAADFLSEISSGVDEYEVDIEDARKEFIGGSWMGATDSDDERKGSRDEDVLGIAEESKKE
jgi:hypothetical protein